MSHSTVLVIGDNPEEQLAPFDEDLTLPRYVEYTRQQLIDKERKEIENYKNTTYAEYLADPEAYEAGTTNEAHIRYLKEEFPEKLTWSDDELYEHAIRWYEKEDIGKDGEVYSTLNPQAKWDWYSLGGRWAGFFTLKPHAEGIQGHHRAKDFALINGTEVDDLPPEQVDQAYKGDIDWQATEDILKKERAEWYDKEMTKPESERFTWDSKVAQMSREEYVNKPGAICTFAVLKDGVWYERGEMGWWGSVSNKKDDDAWDKEWKELVDSLPDNTLLSVYDVHI